MIMDSSVWLASRLSCERTQIAIARSSASSACSTACLDVSPHPREHEKADSAGNASHSMKAAPPGEKGVRLRRTSVQGRIEQPFVRRHDRNERKGDDEEKRE